jgi:hypothetical protein
MSWLSLLPVVATLFAEAPASLPSAVPVADVPSVAAPPAAYPASPPAGAPLLAPVPASTASPPAEGGLAAGQFLVGTLATLAFGFGTAAAFVAARDPTLILFSAVLTPAVGAGVICAIGRQSRFYTGDCATSMAGGYLGAVVVGAGLGLVLYYGTPLTGNGDADSFHWLYFVEGAALGIVLGTGIGATAFWHLGKHRRQGDTGVAVGLSAPPLPPPAALADWPELRARTPAPAGGVVVGIPLLALRF